LQIIYLHKENIIFTLQIKYLHITINITTFKLTSNHNNMFNKQNKLKTISILLVLITVLFTKISCKKAEITANEIAIENVVEKFFENTNSLSPSILKIVNEFKERQKINNHLIQDLVKNNGYPVWNKSLTQINGKTLQTGRNTISDNDTIVVVPFVLPNTLVVNAYIEANINDSITLFLNQSNSYSSLPYNGISVTNNTAEKAALRFIDLSHNVFGYNSFKIIDKKLFHNSTSYTDTNHITRKVTIKNNTTGRLNNTCVEIITSTTNNHCPYAFNQCPNIYTGVIGSCDGCATSCTTTTSTTVSFCSGWWQSGSGTGLGGNNSGGPTGSGGPGGGIVSGGGTVGWLAYDVDDDNNDGFPDYLNPYTVTNITDSLQNYPCAKAIVQQAAGINGNLTNNITKVIKNTFNKNTKFNIEFVPRTNIPGSGATELVSFTTSPSLNNATSSLINMKAKIKLLINHLTGATKIAIASTVMHEGLHAYLYYRQLQAINNVALTDSLQKEFGFLEPYNTLNIYGAAHHEQMALTYVTQLANALKEMYPLTIADIPASTLNLFQLYYPQVTIDDYYKAIAWGGLIKDENNNKYKGWSSFEANNPSLAQLTTIIITAENGATSLSIIPKCN
jgi:hypothetical protein